MRERLLCGTAHNSAASPLSACLGGYPANSPRGSKATRILVICRPLRGTNQIFWITTSFVIAPSRSIDANRPHEDRPHPTRGSGLKPEVVLLCVLRLLGDASGHERRVCSASDGDRFRRREHKIGRWRAEREHQRRDSHVGKRTNSAGSGAARDLRVLSRGDSRTSD
jgi:hypothetical protein